MIRLRSVGSRLALALFAIVACVLATVYVIVVPAYERSLLNARISTLQSALGDLVLQRPQAFFLTQQWVDDVAAPTADARVVVFRTTRAPLRATAIADSTPRTSPEMQNDPVVLRAVASGRRESGTVTRNAARYAEVVYPFSSRRRALLLATPLHNDAQTVSVVRGRVRLAGSIGLVVAMFLGYLLARLFTRRIRRLELAAERIADGRFDEPVVDNGDDELGQLARAFDRMRLRLASLDRARSEFIANASHELRTPIFSIGAFLELIESEDLDSDTREEFLGDMREQVSRLGKLATDLLDLGRLDAGRMTVDSDELDLGRIAAVLEGEFAARALASEHALAVAGDGVALVQGDELRVLQIGRILIDNAMAHTPPGTQVTLRWEREEDRGVLIVTDDGPGIPADATGQVFERFYRLEGTLASGSGLGLAIARELAELMGGRVELRSRAGETAFRLVLPARSLAARLSVR